MFSRIGEVVRTDAQAASVGAHQEITPSLALKGAVTWSGGVEKKEEDGFAFS